MKIYPVLKRGIDIILAILALILLSPLLIMVVIFIRLDSKGPIFYKQVRPGRDKKLFEIYKFRTMVQGADKNQRKGVEVKKGDVRITPIGKLLRRYKIDELSQLINVLKGDMSLVGPRPTLPDYLDEYEDWEIDRFKVRPGLTGLAQVNGNIYLEQKEKSIYDVKYVANMSFFLDVHILFKTVLIVIFGEEKYVNRHSVSQRRI